MCEAKVRILKIFNLFLFKKDLDIFINLIIGKNLFKQDHSERDNKIKIFLFP